MSYCITAVTVILACLSFNAFAHSAWAESAPINADATARVLRTLEAAIAEGAPRFNAGDAAGCAAVYEQAVQQIVRDHPGVTPLRHLERGLALGAMVETASQKAWAYRRVMDDTLAELRGQGFRPRIEAPLPQGFPPPGPLGQVVLKRYAAYRDAYIENGDGFWPLFSHIQRENIAMTAPVTMGVQVLPADAKNTAERRIRMISMAFLYEKPTMGQPGQDPGDSRVQVRDQPAMQVLSIGLRGEQSQASVAWAMRTLEQALAANDELRPSGDAPSFRVLGYNSPMVPEPRRFYEVQLVVEPADSR